MTVSNNSVSDTPFSLWQLTPEEQEERVKTTIDAVKGIMTAAKGPISRDQATFLAGALNSLKIDVSQAYHDLVDIWVAKVHLYSFRE